MLAAICIRCIRRGIDPASWCFGTRSPARKDHLGYLAGLSVPLLSRALSASPVHRLVPGTPEWLSLQVLSAFCDILSCTPAGLAATTTAENAGVRKTADGDLPAQIAAAARLRPRPARILRRYSGEPHRHCGHGPSASGHSGAAAMSRGAMLCV